MKQSALATVALLGTSALAASVGQAVVVNSCTYEVHLADVPAAGGGYVEEDKILSPGQTWSQTWTELSNGDGWSIKLSQSASQANIMQYEYTFHNDGSIWYDLSDVNGNPWDGNWEITANTESCTPKQRAYRSSNDDAYGMQWCPSDASITVILCSAESQSDPIVSAVSSIVAGESTATSLPTIAATVPLSTSSPPAAAPTTEASSTTTIPAATTYTHHSNHLVQDADVDASTSLVASPTTFATLTTAVEQVAPGVTVVEVETAIVTEVVTAVYTAPSRVKRHEHHAGHHNA